MMTKTKHTIESVTADLRQEMKGLKRKWSFAGDVNDIEHGGVRYRRCQTGGIEFVYYIGLANIPDGSGIANKYWGFADIEDLIERLPKVWQFADGENCGFNIGWLMSSLESWEGYLTQ